MFGCIFDWSQEIAKSLHVMGVGEDEMYSTMHIIELILQLTPEACWVPDCVGRFPLQRVVGDPELAHSQDFPTYH